LQSEASCRNRVKYNVLNIAGVWPTYLFVAGSIILLQCLSMIHKTGTNLRNDEIWRLLYLEQTPAFCELEKINIMSNRWKRNKFTWHLLQQGYIRDKFLKITRTWCSTELIFFNPDTCQFVKKQALLSEKFWKNIYQISCC